MMSVAGDYHDGEFVWFGVVFSSVVPAPGGGFLDPDQEITCMQVLLYICNVKQTWKFVSEGNRLAKKVSFLASYI